MKKVLGFILMCVLMSVSANLYAQDAGRWAKKVAKEIATMTKVMNLSADQQSQMTKVLTDFYVGRDEARAKEGDERKQLSKAVKKNRDEGVAKICTPEQRTLWKKYNDERTAQNKKK